MRDIHPRRWRLLPLIAAAALVTAYGGGDDALAATSAVPQLSSASSAQLAGTCADVAGRLTGLANTTITSVSTVAAGSLMVAGQPVRQRPSRSAPTSTCSWRASAPPAASTPRRA